MPPRRRAPAPPPIDIEAVRRKLDEGKIVRVGISKSAQFPDGGTGRVRRVGDPSVDGDEYVQVELSLNGTRDVLPFTPGDLTPATRAKVAAVPRDPSTAVTVTSHPHRVTSASSTAVHRASASASAASGQPVSGPPIASEASEHTSGDSSATESARPRANERPPAGPSAARGKGSRSGKKSPPVAITIATTDTEPPQWKIEARVGSRVVLRSGSVAPARVWELVRQLDEETLTSTVGGILDEQRRSAQARADALAAELAQVRAELEALPNNNR